MHVKLQIEVQLSTCPQLLSSPLASMSIKTVRLLKVQYFCTMLAALTIIIIYAQTCVSKNVTYMYNFIHPYACTSFVSSRHVAVANMI